MRDVDPEQIRRFNEATQRVTESLNQTLSGIRRFREALEKLMPHLEEEARHEISQEVQGFASMLDNMTDSQIWRGIQPDSDRLD